MDDISVLRVLYLEDSPSDAELVLEVLTDGVTAIEMSVAADQAGYEDLLVEGRYDVILCDFAMPGFDAHHALELAMVACPTTPFVCVSGKIGEEATVDLLRKGADDIVLKDRLARLPFAIRRAIDDRAHQRELQESEERYRLLAENSQDLIYLIDRDDRVSYVNRASAEALGRSRDELVGTALPELFDPETSRVMKGNLDRVFESGETVKAESELVYPSGPAWITTTLVPFKDDDDNVTAVFGVSRDISKLKRSNEQLEQLVAERTDELTETIAALVEANEAKTRFLRSMSHELRTPLNSVIGFSTMLAEGMPGEVNEEQERQLLMIRTSGHHLLALINEILDLSRIEAGAVELTIEPIDAAALVADVVAECSQSATAKGLDLKMDLPKAALRFRSDSTKVRQILLNLLGNAIKYTDVGSVIVRVSSPSDGLIAFCVADTGSGIPADELDRIFGEFEQAAGRSPGVEGTGLGLAISRGLACSLGGTLYAASEVGVGSTFTLTLPETTEP